MGGVERTSRANVPGKSELQIGESGPVRPEGVKGGIWADGREAVPYGSFGSGRTVPDMEFEACELNETARPERGRRFARGVRRGPRRAGQRAPGRRFDGVGDINLRGGGVKRVDKFISGIHD